MTSTVRLRQWCLLTLLACNTVLAEESSIAQLLAAGRLQVNSGIEPVTSIVPGQRLQLTLEIATDTWFSGGTRIGIPEIPGLVILQTEQFANNASETRDGQPWVIQRWTLDVFPQRAGDFTIDALPLQLQVNDGRGRDVTGEVRSPAVRFSVAIPDSLARAGQWVASPDFTVTQRFDRSLEDLVVGDAFEHEIRFEASDVLAMMLPTFEAERQSGLAAYPAPPELDNSNNRGQSRAVRITRVSYVVEQPGDYLLGAREYLWWNTTRGELELLSLPQAKIQVAGSKPPAAGPVSSLDAWRWLAGVAAVGLLVWLAARLSPRLPGDKVRAHCRALVRRWQTLRRPALPSRLNPDSSAGE